MQNKIIVLVLGLVVLGGGYFFITKNDATDNTAALSNAEAEQPAVPAAPITGGVEVVMKGEVKEFTMDAFYDEKGKWFSLKEMSVKKGDTVRVTITNTKGKHDFTIDEYGIKKELPLNEKVVVEFVADKAGDFVYYCSMPGHRDGGQWGTLHVTE